MQDHTHLMQGMTAQHLRFTVQPLEDILFNGQIGSALRGALYQALSQNFCSEPNGPLTPDHAQRCPVCWLLAAEDKLDARGQDLPRPLTVEPPLEFTFRRGDKLQFGFTLIGQAQNLLPYVARAVQKMGQIGVGVGRGRFKLQQIEEVNPLLDAERTILEQNCVKAPTLQVTPVRIGEIAATLPTHHVALEFLTPIRLIGDNQVLKKPDPVVFVERLLERCQRLAEHYAETASPPSRDDWYTAYQTLSQAARTLSIGVDYTVWEEGWSGSRRQQKYTPVSGLVGIVRWDGDVRPLLPWLLWGQTLHVGKNAVKGNGWYRVFKP